MYPCAATVLVPRLCLFVFGIALHVLLHKILLFGQDMEKPLPSMVRKSSKLINKLGGGFVNLVVGIIPRVRHVDVDYTKWLGPDYKSKPFEPGYRTPTYVMNHICAYDGTLLFWALNGDISFLAGDFVRKIPLLG